MKKIYIILWFMIFISACAHSNTENVKHCNSIGECNIEVLEVVRGAVQYSKYFNYHDNDFSVSLDAAFSKNETLKLSLPRGSVKSRKLKEKYSVSNGLGADRTAYIRVRIKKYDSEGESFIACFSRIQYRKKNGDVVMDKIGDFAFFKYGNRKQNIESVESYIKSNITNNLF